MKLGKLIEGNIGSIKNIEIDGIAFDTSAVKQNTLFFCLKGRRNDGHDYAVEAEKKGAVCIVAEREIQGLTCPVIVVKNSRLLLSRACSNFYDNPEDSLEMVAITGTNGKTTTAYIVRNILLKAGKKVGMIGTNGIFIGENRLPNSGMTTPDPIELFKSLRVMVNESVEIVIMEASAHALALNKLDGICFTIAAFTNFTQDHLDFFGNLNDYAAAKLRLFTKISAKSVVTNMDDELGRKISRMRRGKTLSYGLENPADAFAVNEQFGEAGVRFVMNLCDDLINVTCSLAGKFNIYNIMCASLIAKMLGISSENIEAGIRSLHRVDGRFNVINTAKYSIIIDFAHTGDGLRNGLEAIKEFSNGKIITVFGCGGDRDKDKRSKMGKIATTLSDYCIITSDNPRSEQPESIINEIISGIEKDNYITVTDRRQAIRHAVEMAEDNDVIFIAGKGAEKYQEINGVKYDYNDEEYVQKLIEEDVIK